MEQQIQKMGSLEELYMMYKRQIYTLCIRLTDSRVQAEDLYSETWLKVAEKYGNINRHGNSMAWVYTVCINIYRKSKFRKEGSLAVNSSTDTMQDITAGSIEATIIEQETSVAIQKAIQTLDDKYRIPIILFYFRDFSYDDISKIMGIPMSTVKYRLNYAKGLLRNEINIKR